MKYNRIDVYYDKDSKFKYALVETNIGEIKITDEGKFKSLYEEIKETDEKVEFEVHKEGKEEVKEERKSEIDEIIYEVDEEYRTKKKGKKIVKGLVIFGSVAVLATGVCHLVKYTNWFNSKTASFTKDDNIKDDDYYKIVVDNSNGKTTVFDGVMDKVVDNQSGTKEVTTRLSEDNYNNLSSKEIMNALDNNWRLANSSIIEISNYINNGKLNGSAYYSNFSTYLPNSKDKAVVGYFSSLRNEIVRSAYEYKNVSLVKSNTKTLYSNFAEFITGNNYFLDSQNGKNVKVYYDDLSDMAKSIVLQIGMSALTMDVDYKYNAENMDKFDVLEKAETLYYNDVLPSITKGSSK